jgi:hypothetical protein
VRRIAIVASVAVVIGAAGIVLTLRRETPAQRRNGEARSLVRTFVEDAGNADFGAACALVARDARIRAGRGGCEGVLGRQKGISYDAAPKGPLTLIVEESSSAAVLITATVEGAGFDSGGPGDLYTVSFGHGRATISGLNELF